MRILRFVAKRLISLIPILFILVTVTFIIAHVVPGDPVALAAGDFALPQQVELMRQEYGLDRPLWVQYVRFWQRLARGDLGRSLTTRNAVLHDMARFLPATVELAAVAFVFAAIMGVITGVISAVRTGGLFDHSLRLISISGVSTPRFWLGLLLQIVFVGSGILPISGRIDTSVQPPTTITGMYLIDGVITGNWAAFWSSVAHIVLPAFTLSLSIIGVTQRLTRAMLLEILGNDYILNAYLAAGLPKVLVQYKYALKNALIPVITHLGLSVGVLLSGSLLVETVFNWPGIGLYIVRAGQYTDFQPILAGVLLAGVVFVTGNLVTDIVYRILDPRIEF
jgi:peptide/nickel transport system permease protein